MTPYELIEELEERHLQGCIYQDAANMLRQQAETIAKQSDRIAELEKDLNRLLKSYGGMAAKIEEMGGAYQEPKEHIEDLYPLFSSYIDPKGNVYRIPFNSTTPQTKPEGYGKAVPLSDEEILKCWHEYGQMLTIEQMRIAFGRAIEAKVMGKE